MNARLSLTREISEVVLAPRPGGRGHAVTPVLSGTFTIMAGATVASAIPVLVAGLLVMAVGLGILTPNVSNWVVSIAPPEMRGRCIGVLTARCSSVSSRPR